MHVHIWIDCSAGKITMVKPQLDGYEIRVVPMPIQADLAYVADELDLMVKHQGKKILFDLQWELPSY